MPAAAPLKQSFFPTTHWSLVEMMRRGDVEPAACALEELCAMYWYPVYAFLRRSGHGEHDAEDLTQAFFERLISDQSLLAARPEKGKLRTFLLALLMRTLSDYNRYRGAQKRGGGLSTISFDAMDAEERYAKEPREEKNPETFFSRAWANELLDQVRGQLREVFVKKGKAEVFDILAPFLRQSGEPPEQAGIARKLGCSSAAARVQIFRLRHKFRELLRQRVAQTVLSSEEIDEEMAWLYGVLEGYD